MKQPYTATAEFPADCRELLKLWDDGQCIWSVEMGGLGLGYEQGIQILAIEMIRDNLDIPLPEKPSLNWGSSTVDRIDKKLPDGSFSCGGFSGAQFGAARLLKLGPKVFYDSIPEDRKILVSKFFPRVPEGV